MNTTILASLMADGTGVPAVWRKAGPCAHSYRFAHSYHPDDALDLSDPTTYREGCAQLAAWLGVIVAVCWLAPDRDRPGHWLLMTAYGNGVMCLQSFGVASNPETAAEALAEILQGIAEDHRIRRACGMEVMPGTVAELKFSEGGWLVINHDGDIVEFRASGWEGEHHDCRPCPALAGITNYAKAREAIAAEVAP